MVDLSVYQRLVPLAQAMKQNQRENLQNQLIQANVEKAQRDAVTGGGSTPAALQLANEYLSAMQSGNLDRANAIAAFAKTVDKNVQMTQGGQYQPLPGLPSALGALEFGKESGTQQARDIYEPGRAGAVEAQKLEQQRQYEPQIEAAKKSATIRAEDIAKAQTGLGQTLEQSRQMIDLINQIEKSPGLSAVVGAPNPMQGGFGLFNIPGTPAADFRAKLDQLGGKQFLEAFESLKGGGAITQIEGEKATNAIARMQTSQSEKAFIEALNEFKQIVQRAAERAQAKAGQQALPPVFSGLPPELEFEQAVRQQQQNIGTSPMQRPELSLPQAGAVEDGYMFMGGDPSNPSSWKKVQ